MIHRPASRCIHYWLSVREDHPGDRGYGRQRSGGRVQYQHPQLRKFIDANADKNIDIECIGRKGRDFLRRRFPVAPQDKVAQDTATQDKSAQAKNRARPGCQ